ncbi:MAG: zinc ribbon domain-containing protein [Bacteroidaceae bacterium]|nr:zinc ribbon domain-containing protein [Bacteroidaceae bacterium]
MRNKWWILLVVGLFSSCHYPQQGEEYEVGYNFEVIADSLVLQEDRPMHLLIVPESSDSFVVFRGDPLVVAQIETIPEDSIDSVWVKVARDQLTMGWLHESVLLESVVPDDPISQGIHLFSDSHLLGAICLAFAVLAAWLIRRMMHKRYHMVHIDDIASPFPMLLCLCMACSAVLYASIQHFVPETWCYFYYHPTLNPFGLPAVLSAFLFSVWLMVVLSGAVLDDIYHSLRTTEGLLYGLSLMAVLGLVYVFFSVTTMYYVGYLFLPLYIVAAIWQYVRRHRARYCCGQCGARLHDLGECTKCGTVNQ